MVGTGFAKQNVCKSIFQYLLVKGKPLIIMKNFVIGFFAIVFFASCSKNSDGVAPEQPLTSENIFFRDANISVADMKVLNNGKPINISFITRYEINIVKIEVMGGITTSNLYKIYQRNISAASNQVKTYNVTDAAPAGQVMYYAIRYTLHNGDWAMTPAFKYISQN